MGRRRSKKKNNNNSEQKTPYQGKKRTFGEFHCTECDKYWMSAHSWANTAQQCLDCDTWIYPFRQVPLLRTKKKKDAKKPHQTAHCGKCIELGKPCVQFTYDNTKEKK